MSYVPEKGDIVQLNFNPSAGSEIMKRRPALVISRKEFNAHTGFAIVAPITSTKHGIALEVPLERTTTQGVVLVHQLRSLDVDSREVEFVEQAPQQVSDKVTQLAGVIIQ